MGFIHIKPVNAQILKVDGHIIFVIIDFILCLFQPFLGFLQHQFHLFDGILGILGIPKFIQHILVFTNALFLQGYPAFRGNGDALKLRIPHDNRIPVLSSDLGHKGLAVLLFKVTGLGYKDFCLGVKFHKRCPGLFGEVLGHDHQGFLGKPQPFGFHGRSYHFISLPCAYCVSKERVTTI